MKDLSIRVGFILKDNSTNNRYRVIYLDSDFAVLCQMDIDQTKLNKENTRELYQQLYSSTLSIEEEQSIVFDYNELNDKAKECHDKNKAFIEDLAKEFGPTYLSIFDFSSRKKVHMLRNKHNLGKTAYYKHVRQFLQSGLNEYALLDGRHFPTPSTEPYHYKTKTGRKPYYVEKGIIITDEVRKILDKAIKEYRKGSFNSIQSIYNALISDNYTTINQDGTLHYAAETEYPTYNQLYYHLSKEINSYEMKIIKNGKREVDNDHRILESDSLYGVLGPGYMVEMDETELDISVVDRNDRTKCLGKPILYAMVDVYTKAIISISVGFENNSNLGFVKCMLNLGRDKKLFAKNMELY